MGTHQLILASSSPRRRELIQMLGLPVLTMSSGADESHPPQLSPAEIVKTLSQRKAEEARAKLRPQGQQGIVIGADTVVVKNNQILGKPKNEEEAKAMLKLLQGSKHEVYSGIACMDAEQGRMNLAHRQTQVWLKPLTDAQIQAYINSGEPMDKAGAYGIQGLGAVFVDRIEGCYFNVVGLSLSLLSEMLRDFGIEVLK